MASELEKIAFVYGDVCVRKKKQRRKRQKRLFADLLFDYAQNSTLHGLRYIVARGLHIIERLFWLLTFAASIALCSYYIYNVYMKWHTSPVIVSVNERMVSVAMVPFPAVTICPQIKCKKSIYNYTENKSIIKNYTRLHQFVNVSDEYNKMATKFERISTVCDVKNVYSQIQLENNFTDESLIKDITEVALRKDEVFFKSMCSWHGTDEICNELFNKVYTEEGVCYTTNNLAADDIFRKSNIQSKYQYMDSKRRMKGWSLEAGYNHSDEFPYPRRGREDSVQPDLTLLLLHNDEHRDEACNGLYAGYKIYLHHPADFPQSSLYYYAGLPNQVTSLAISFQQMDTDLDLRAYSSEVRQCYFPRDRQLRFFKIYTENNCKSECLSNYTYGQCGCVEFYMPHNNSREICMGAKRECVKAARSKYI